MEAVGIAIFLGALLVTFAAFPRRSKRVPENVVQFVPKSNPAKATIEAAGQVIEFPRERANRKGDS